MRATFDTNILVYAHDADAGERHRVARELPEAAIISDRLHLTLQSLSEFFRILTVKKRLPSDEAMRLVEDLRRSAEVTVADYECLQRAMKQVAQHAASFWDAMLWATAAKAGCSYVLTEDGQHGRLFDGVTLIDPFRPESAPLLRRLTGGAP